MGVLHGRDLLSTKYLTAIILDAVSGAHFVPIKHEIGPYFFAKIKDDLYAFDTRGEQWTYRETLVKSFRFIIYFTDCFKPVSQYHKELEVLLKKEYLPLMDRMMLRFLTILGRAESKQKFVAHKIPEVLNRLEQKKEGPKYAELYKNMITFVKDLEIDEISTPVRRITESVTNDFIIPDAKFMASIRSAFETLDREDKIINNVPIGAKTAWAKWIALLSMIGFVTLLAWVGYDQGWFSFIENMIPDLGGVSIPFGGVGGPGTPTDAAFRAAYPTPEAAKAALDAGKISLSDIPPSMRDLVQNTPTPQAEPQKIEIGG